MPDEPSGVLTLEDIANLKLPEPPSAEELKEQALQEYNFIKPFLIENWPVALRQLSFKDVSIPISRHAIRAIIKDIDHPQKKTAEEQDALFELEETAAAVLLRDPFKKSGAFIRLGSRSPKDTFIGSPKVHTIEEAYGFISDSIRMFDDLCMFWYSEQPCHLWVREFVDIEPWEEFRCFASGGKLRAISQYYYRDGENHEEIWNHADKIRWLIEVYYKKVFSPCCHLDDVVFDVYVNGKKGTCDLIEINPLCGRTDPCLLRFAQDDTIEAMNDGTIESVRFFYNGQEEMKCLK